MCNDPAAVRRALERAGFTDIALTTAAHLARAWGRRWPTFALGLVGDLLTGSMPSRRSTIVAVARVPGAGWNLGTFGVAVLPGLALATAIAALGARRK